MTAAEESEIKALLDQGMTIREAIAKVIPGKRVVPKKAR